MEEPLHIAARFFGGPVDGMVLPVDVPLRLRFDITWNIEAQEVYSTDGSPAVYHPDPVVSVPTSLVAYRLREYTVSLPLLDFRRVRVYVREGIDPRVVVNDVRAAYKWPMEFDVYDHEPSSLAIR